MAICSDGTVCSCLANGTGSTCSGEKVCTCNTDGKGSTCSGEKVCTCNTDGKGSTHTERLVWYFTDTEDGAPKLAKHITSCVKNLPTSKILGSSLLRKKTELQLRKTLEGRGSEDLIINLSSFYKDLFPEATGIEVEMLVGRWYCIVKGQGVFHGQSLIVECIYNNIACTRNADGTLACHTKKPRYQFKTLKDAAHWLFQKAIKRSESQSERSGIDYCSLDGNDEQKLLKFLEEHRSESLISIPSSLLSDLSTNATGANKVDPDNSWYLLDNIYKFIVECHSVTHTELVLSHFNTSEEAVKWFSENAPSPFNKDPADLVKTNVYNKLLKTMEENGSEDLIIIAIPFYEDIFGFEQIDAYFSQNGFYVFDKKAKTIIEFCL